MEEKREGRSGVEADVKTRMRVEIKIERVERVQVVTEREMIEAVVETDMIGAVVETGKTGTATETDMIGAASETDMIGIAIETDMIGTAAEIEAEAEIESGAERVREEERRKVGMIGIEEVKETVDVIAETVGRVGSLVIMIGKKIGGNTHLIVDGQGRIEKAVGRVAEKEKETGREIEEETEEEIEEEIEVQEREEETAREVTMSMMGDGNAEEIWMRKSHSSAEGMIVGVRVTTRRGGGMRIRMMAERARRCG